MYKLTYFNLCFYVNFNTFFTKKIAVLSRSYTSFRNGFWKNSASPR